MVQKPPIYKNGDDWGMADVFFCWPTINYSPLLTTINGIALVIFNHLYHFVSPTQRKQEKQILQSPPMQYLGWDAGRESFEMAIFAGDTLW